MYKKLLPVIILVLVAGCGCPPPEQVGERYEQEVPPVRRREAVPAEVTPQGQIAFISPGRNLHIINADGSGEKRLVAADRWSRPAWSPDGERIAFWGQGGGLSVINIDNLEITQLTAGGGRHLQWLPDGQRLLLRKQEGLWLTNRDGTDLVQIILPGRIKGCCAGSRISPDGTKIAYFTWLGEDYGRAALAVVNLDGTGQVILSQGYPKREVRGIAWSPDGERIAYYTRSEGLKVINRDGSNRISINRWGWRPAWTPDGKILYWVREDLYIVNPDGTGRRVFIPDLWREVFPRLTSGSWSPCGRWLVIERGGSIYIGKADGTALRRLVSGVTPQWSPRTP